MSEEKEQPAKEEEIVPIQTNKTANFSKDPEITESKEEIKDT